MKNRLQIKYHIPESLPTRTQAMAYLRETFAIGRTNTKNTSLPAEPLVLLYNDTLLDVANGITEAKRLETANVLLAIGRGGDGVNVFNNQDYFVIDFAKHDEEITDLNQAVDGILDVIAEVKTTINEMKANITNNTNDIANIIKTIGEKGDQSEKDTVYGYIQGAYDAIDNEVNRAKNAELNLQHAITNEATRISNEETRAKQAEADLQAHINTEENSRIEGDEINRDAIIAESERANEAEAELRNDLVNEVNRSQAEETRINNRLNDEIARATSKENALDAKIDETNIRLSEEVARATTAENTLTAKINEETEARKTSDNDLQTQVTDLAYKVDSEISNRTSEDSRLEGKIDDTGSRLNEEIIRATVVERELSTKIDEEKETRRAGDENLQTQVTELKHNVATESATRNTEDKRLETKIDDNTRRIAENQVSSSRKTIIVTGPSANGTNVEVNIDNKTIVADESGILSVSSDALVQYDGTNAIQVSEVTGGVKTIALNINPNDKILTNDINGLLATLSLKWVKGEVDGEKDEIQLIGRDGNIISRIDVADFIKDGILDNVTLNTDDTNNPYLSFTFNSASGKNTINVPVKDLVDVYLAGNGLTLNENTFSVKIDVDSEVFLSVSENGVKLSGVQQAIDLAKNTIDTKIDNEVKTLNNTINNLTQHVNEKVNDLLQDDSDIRTEFKTADNTLRNEFNAAHNALNGRLVTAEGEIDALQVADTIIRGEFAAADTTIRGEFADADDEVRKEFKAADSALETAYKTADTALENAYKTANANLEAAYKAADELLRAEFAGADNTLRNEVTTADSQLRADFTAADDTIRQEFAAADAIAINNLKNELHAKDDELEAAFQQADNEINIKINSIDSTISSLSTLVNQNLNDAKAYTDNQIAEVNANHASTWQELRNSVNSNQTELAKINGDVSVDGSIKDIVFDSALGTIVNTVTLENATEQSLIKKFTNEGKPYIYVSNNTTDMKHNGDSLNNVLNNIRNDIDETIGATEEIKTNLNTLAEKVSGHDNTISGIQSDVAKLQEDFGQLEDKITNTITNLLVEMQKTIETLQTKLDSVDYNLQEAQSNIQTLQTTAITSIEGVANQIQVDIEDNKAIIGFATDAYFIAG